MLGSLAMTDGWTAKVLTVAAIVSCCSLPACKGCSQRKSSVAAERPSLAGVAIKPIAKASFLGTQIQIDEARLAAKSRKVLEDAEVFSPPEAKRPAAHVSLEAEIFSATVADATEIGAKVRLRITVRPAGVAPARFSENVEAVGQAPLAKGDVNDARAAFQSLAERTAADLLLAYLARLKLWEVSTHEISAALQSADNDLRVEALRVIGARKLREEIPAILRLLSDEDENVRDAALGALVALREKSAVKALAESRQMRDTREMRKILDAIATLGGREARDYLGFVAETHDDEEIRGMAKEALNRLSRRDEAK